MDPADTRRLFLLGFQLIPRIITDAQEKTRFIFHDIEVSYAIMSFRLMRPTYFDSRIIFYLQHPSHSSGLPLYSSQTRRSSHFSESAPRKPLRFLDPASQLLATYNAHHRTVHTFRLAFHPPRSTYLNLRHLLPNYRIYMSSLCWRYSPLSHSLGRSFC